MNGKIEHHTHYKEIDGFDKTVWMTRRDHRLLHDKLREEGKCNISPEEVRKISNAAEQRTPKRKKYKKEYYQKNKEYRQEDFKNYYEENEERIKAQKKEYYQKNKERIKAQRKENYNKKEIKNPEVLE